MLRPLRRGVCGFIGAGRHRPVFIILSRAARTASLSGASADGPARSRPRSAPSVCARPLGVTGRLCRPLESAPPLLASPLGPHAARSSACRNATPTPRTPTSSRDRARARAGAAAKQARSYAYPLPRYRGSASP